MYVAAAGLSGPHGGHGGGHHHGHGGFARGGRRGWRGAWGPRYVDYYLPVYEEYFISGQLGGAVIQKSSIGQRWDGARAMAAATTPKSLNDRIVVTQVSSAGEAYFCRFDPYRDSSGAFMWRTDCPP